MFRRQLSSGGRCLELDMAVRAFRHSNHHVLSLSAWNTYQPLTIRLILPEAQDNTSGAQGNQRPRLMTFPVSVEKY